MYKTCGLFNALSQYTPGWRETLWKCLAKEHNAKPGLECKPLNTKCSIGTTHLIGPTCLIRPTCTTEPLHLPSTSFTNPFKWCAWPSGWTPWWKFLIFFTKPTPFFIHHFVDKRGVICLTTGLPKSLHKFLPPIFEPVQAPLKRF